MRSFFMNNFKVHHWDGSAWEEIPHPVFPLGFSSLLDERLDEAYVTFYNAEKNEYKPTDIFALTFYENGVAVKNLGLCVAMDRVTNLPLGSERYKHELSLIEPTKLAEGIQCQTLTFTNDLGKVYTANAKAVAPVIPEDVDNGESNLALAITDFSLNIESPVKTPFSLPSIRQLGDRFAERYNEQIESATGSLYRIELIANAGMYGSSQLKVNTESINDLDEVKTLSSGTYEITYIMAFGVTYDDDQTSYAFAQYNFSIIVVQNRLPLLPYTITDVTCRCLELAEPLSVGNLLPEEERTPEGNLFSEGELPRIIFDGVQYSDSLAEARSYASGSQAEKYSKVFAPELAITQANLREQLKRIGGYIHAEPRIKLNYEKNTDGSPGKAPTFVLYFDPLIQSKAADLKKKGFLIYRGLSRSINEYNTEVRSNAANLVNTLDYAQGVVTEPHGVEENGYKSLRADLNQRMSEENAYAPTEKGIYAITRVMCGIVRNDGAWDYIPVDITAYVLEKASYDLLSDYDKDFPNARSLALYYTQGQEGIHGFFTKSSTVGAFQPWQNYAIVRILAREMNVSEDTIQKKIVNAAQGIGKIVTQISYIPIYENMISHSKQKYVPSEIPFAQNYSQSDNLVETRYFGENIKGVAARLGNLEEERTYTFRSVNDLPNEGETVDGFVIAGIEAQFMPTYTKASLYLAKKFNRISEFVGINSNKRVYEVSEREAYERHILVKNKIVFSNDSLTKSAESAIVSTDDVMSAFTGANDKKLISAVGIKSYSNRGTQVGSDILLPVVSSAFGNAMTFTFSMKDNYSAGEKIAYVEEDGVSGYWASDVPYADYYGRISYLTAYFKQLSSEAQLNAIHSLPEVEINTFGLINLNNLFIDKDSRERLSFTVELEAQTTEDDIIIGSGFASGNPLVTSNPVKPLLYLYDTPFTEFDTNIADNKGKKIKEYVSGSGYTYANGCITFPNSPTVVDLPNGKVAYWAIAYPRSLDETTEYEDKFGKTVTSSTYKGGEILLASTTPVTAGNNIHAPIYVTIQKQRR